MGFLKAHLKLITWLISHLKGAYSEDIVQLVTTFIKFKKNSHLGFSVAAGAGCTQSFSLHSATSCKLPSQFFPSNCGAGLLHSRVRALCPIPQVAEHAPNSAQFENPPSIGHGFRCRHGCNSSFGPSQSLPPWEGGGESHFLVLFRFPSLHVLSHSAQSVHGPKFPFTGHSATLHCLVSMWLPSPMQSAPNADGLGLVQLRYLPERQM